MAERLFIKAGNKLFNAELIRKIEASGSSAITITWSDGTTENVTADPQQVLDRLENYNLVYTT